MQQATRAFVRLSLDRQGHLTFLREFDGVAHEIDDDLTEAARIAGYNLRDVGRDFTQQLQIRFFMSR